MALPNVQSLQDCSNFSKTVAPYLSQAYDLSLLRWNSTAASSPGGIYGLYVNTNPLVSAFAFSIFAGFVFFIVSEVNRNYSQVDRMWSTLPAFYAWHIALWARAAGLPHSRSDLLAVVVTVWSARLTYNYWRRGGYSVGSEDYRWVYVQKWFPAGTFVFFNFSFISMFQSVLLFLLSGPASYSLLLACQLHEDIEAGDVFYSALVVALVAFEWVSDGQQWSYQNAKSSYRKDARVPLGYKQHDLDRGFVTSGAWAYSRHPSFAAEQMIWLIVYLWVCYVSVVLYNWTFLGPGILLSIFYGSTVLTEAISGSKYPEYAEYQKRVGKFVPVSLEPYRALPIKKHKLIRTSELTQPPKQK